MIIALEGIDFAGKTTQAELLLDWFLNQNISVNTFKFPDTTLPTGELIAKYLRGEVSFYPAALLALFSANRLETKPTILKATETSDVIICDRYCQTAYAYGLARGLPKEWLIPLEALMPRPDIVFVLDISAKTSLTRRTGRGKIDIIEADLEFQERSRQCFLDLSKESIATTENWVIINGEKPISEVHEHIVQFYLEKKSKLTP